MGYLKPTPKDLDDDLKFHFTLAAFQGDPLFKDDPLFRTNLKGAVEYVRARKNVVVCRSEYLPSHDLYWCGGGKVLSTRIGLDRLRASVQEIGGRFIKPPSPLSIRLGDHQS